MAELKINIDGAYLKLVKYLTIKQPIAMRELRNLTQELSEREDSGKTHD